MNGFVLASLLLLHPHWPMHPPRQRATLHTIVIGAMPPLPPGVAPPLLELPGAMP